MFFIKELTVNKFSNKIMMCLGVIALLSLVGCNPSTSSSSCYSNQQCSSKTKRGLFGRRSNNCCNNYNCSGCCSNNIEECCCFTQSCRSCSYCGPSNGRKSKSKTTAYNDADYGRDMSKKYSHKHKKRRKRSRN